ncbi:DUF5956 family protein [Micromonospora yangpuensis]|uniref:Uncharacterized protein n=1 Tax=Micromonospora yangpuensis TaxID=683228 RepID=A0A1C6UAB4_9ACTN|nr:DUF5956 family protein [Micromonospora yangpuensis]GGL87848.1 hypothetical protein GCM10012279_01870 [Micromonospora yangpuensis]SCL50908.1 hypothetical protein GA0070617_1629 [Micromonospora yangpuensis]
MADSETSAGGWHDVPLLPASLAPTDGHEWFELPESTWGALVGWTAGTARMARVPDRVESHSTVTTTNGPAGDERQVRPRTADEQADVDATINEYLQACGAPARPPGYRWFLRLPTGYSEARLWAEVNEALPPSAINPADVASRITQIVSGMYADVGR